MRTLAILAATLAVTASAAIAAPPLEAYGRLPRIGEVALSPSGALLGLTIRDKGEHSLLLRHADGANLALAPISDMRVTGLTWAGDDYAVLLGLNPVRKTQGSLRVTTLTGAVVVPVANRAPYTIFGGSRDMIAAIAGWYGSTSSGGKTYGFVGGFAQRGPQAPGPNGSGPIYPNLYRIDLATGLPFALGTVVSSRSWVVGPDGAVAANARRSEDGLAWTLYAGAQDGKPLLSGEGLNRFQLQGLGRTPGTVLVVERNEGGDAVAREIALDGAPDEQILDPVFADGRPLFDRESKLLIGASDRDGTRVVLLDPVLQKRFEALVRAFPGSRVRMVDYGRRLERIVILTDGPEDAGTYWLADALKKSVTRIGRARPDIAAADVAPTRMVAYKASDGLALEGVLTLPPGREAKGLPLVVIPHGGLLTTGDSVEFDWLAQAFASRGYAVFQPNYRGTVGYGEPFRRAAFGEFGRKTQTDISDGVTALANQGIVDPKRACILGKDYGGYAALAGVTLQQGLYRCAASIGGYADLTQEFLRIREGSGYEQRGVQTYRDLMGSTSPADLDAISPASQAARADAPVLLLYGSDDTNVPLEQTKAMERALRKAGKPVELATIKGADHELTAEPHRQEALARLVAFVEQNNPPQ